MPPAGVVPVNGGEIGYEERVVFQLPRARLETIARTAHFPMLEEPRAFDDAVQRFLTEASRP